MNLDACRRWGYLQAKLDALDRLKPESHPDLAGSPVSGTQFYCGSIGLEFMHLPYPDRCHWLQEQMEAKPGSTDSATILELLIKADVFEQTLQKRYVGTKRYSLEGADALLPLFSELLHTARQNDADECVFGMTHRGRLNVMVNILGRPLADILARFEDVNPDSVLGGGDVKYHLGATGQFADLRLSLSPNPSHLEAVDPVVTGGARARQDRLGDNGTRKVVPVLIHGDAAFAGQGMVGETLNLAGLSGFDVGGTVHVIVNNLIGFTTPWARLHGSKFAADTAKRLPIPIFHVNGEDPDAVVRVAKLAMLYRYKFASDVVVDLICYRRHGHSEVDDPSITQPRLYDKIRKWPRLWESYAQRHGQTAPELMESLRHLFDQAQNDARSRTELPALGDTPGYWAAYSGGRFQETFEQNTAVLATDLKRLGEALTMVPPGFAIHPKVRKLLDERLRMSHGEANVDWGMAEALAFGSLLSDGVRIRLAGQDTRRGTFNQRHAVLVDVSSESEHIPLRDLGSFECYDTPLSESAAVGFEYGYSRDFPEALVLWEAQFGDFVNGAQVIIDQFVAGVEDRWGLLSGLVLLLPHGYEGQGAEHSSARVERFLQLAAEDNLQVCWPSTAAQYFHLLRRQVLRRWRKPLIVLTPKSLLRSPAACSPLEEFAHGRYQLILGDTEAHDVRRIVVSSGKMAHELNVERKRRDEVTTALIRIEQLYPFPERELGTELARYASASEIVWVQEEPANMGALTYILPKLHELSGGRSVRCVRRSESAAVATGSPKAHAKEQAALLAMAFMSSSP